MTTRDRLRELLRIHGRPGPRYTSYPTAVEFGPLGGDDYARHLDRAASDAGAPWSAYVHVPFCQRRCRFCACSVIISPDHDRVAEPYVDLLEREIDLVADHVGERRRLAQLHLGGGTPTYLDPELLDRVYRAIRGRFELQAGAELSIEVDPRATTEAHLDVIASAGVNRISLGVQDLDHRVQLEIGRIQSRQTTQSTIVGARARGIAAVNVDLVYGLPAQRPEGLLDTVTAIVEMGADRVALYGYAHVPWSRGNQRAIDTELLPNAEQRLDLFLLARERFLDAGYVAIGLDHFARPTDPLARADADGQAHRNFMGYTLEASSDLLGFGVTAIGDVAGAYVQNTTKLSRYRDALVAGRLPTERGIVRSDEDSLRARVIMDLMCRHRVRRAEIVEAFALPGFDTHFAAELERLAPMIDQGLVEDDGDTVRLTDTGRLFMRNVAMVFDAYREPANSARLSATV